MVTAAVDRILIDTNVLIYASLRQSAFHTNAVQAIHSEVQAGAELWVSRQIFREYISVLTRPGATTLPSPAATATADVEAFQRLFHVVDETHVVTTNLLTLMRTVPIGGKQVHDANLVATMQAYGISKLLTHNTSDFARFGSLISIIPIVT